MVVTRMF